MAYLISKTHPTSTDCPPSQLWTVVHDLDGETSHGVPVGAFRAVSIRDALQQRFPDDVIKIEKA